MGANVRGGMAGLCSDWEERESYRVITPLCTPLDIAQSPTNWPYLDAAVRHALRRGLVRPRHLLESHVSVLLGARA